MLKLPFLHHEQEQSYNVHGIQYLKQKAREGRATADSDASRFKYLRPASRHKRVTSPKAAAQSSSSCVYPKNDALYVSTDWTENLFDKVSLADVDWMDSSCYPYENLVLSGGGAKGYAFIGALKVGVATQCRWMFVGLLLCKLDTAHVPVQYTGHVRGRSVGVKLMSALVLRKGIGVGRQLLAKTK